MWLKTIRVSKKAAGRMSFSLGVHYPAHGLIELLVVIAILAALLFPALNRAKVNGGSSVSNCAGPRNWKSGR
jgi:Tfp pilus assembly protein FimT